MTTALRTIGAVLALSCAACPGPEPPPPRPTPIPSPVPRPAPPAPALAPTAPIPTAPIPTDEPNVALQLGPYRESFTKLFTESLGKPPTDVSLQHESTPLAHQVLNFGDENPVLVTVGFARRVQPQALGETPKRVELLAEPPHASQAVADVLTALGRWMHDPDRPINVRFRAFESVRVPQPIHGIEHVIIVPALVGTLAGADITILRVIPIAPDEFAHLKMRGDGAARAWWHTRRADPTLRKRWRPN